MKSILYALGCFHEIETETNWCFENETDDWIELIGNLNVTLHIVNKNE